MKRFLNNRRFKVSNSFILSSNIVLDDQIMYYNHYNIENRSITSFSHSNRQLPNNNMINNKIKCLRLFSSSNSDNEIMNEADFHVLCDNTLEHLMDLLIPLEEDDNITEDVDINYSMGVLNIDLGSYGFWVINKQTPNRQIWWSSPVSGPRRYEYNKENNQWFYTKANTYSTNDNTNTNDELITSLLEEIENKTGIKLPSE